MSGLPRTLSRESLFSITSDAPCSEIYRLGDRCQITADGREGIVAFVGTTSFAPGDWVGLVLEKPDGKNDGSVTGVRYFECQAKHGVFCRPSKLTKMYAGPSASSPSISIGVSSPTPSIRSQVTKSLYAQDCGFDVGERVMIHGGKNGVVKFLDRVDGDLIAGILLDRPLGTCDGTYNGVRYFKANPLYGTYVPADKVKKVANVQPAKVAVRHTKTSAMRQWKGSQESLNSIGMSSTCSYRQSPKFSVRMATHSPSMKESDMITSLKTCLQEKEAHLEHLSKELDQQKVEIEILNQLKSKSVNPEEFQRIKSLLAKADSERSELQAQLYMKDNKIEELVFSLDEAEVLQSTLHSELEKLKLSQAELAAEAMNKEKISWKDAEMSSSETQTDEIKEEKTEKVLTHSMSQTDVKQFKESNAQTTKSELQDKECQAEKPKTNEAGVWASFEPEKPTTHDSGCQAVSNFAHVSVEAALRPETNQSQCQTEIKSFTDAQVEAIFEVEKPVIAESGSQTDVRTTHEVGVEAKIEPEKPKGIENGSQAGSSFSSLSHAHMQTETKVVQNAENQTLKAEMSEIAVEANLEPEKPVVTHFSTQTPLKTFADMESEAKFEQPKAPVADSHAQTENATFTEKSVEAKIEDQKPETTHVGVQISPDVVQKSDSTSQTALKKYSEAASEAKIENPKPVTVHFGSQISPEVKPTAHSESQTVTKVFSEVGSEARIENPKAPVAHSESQTVTKEFSEAASEAKIENPKPITAHFGSQISPEIKSTAHSESQTVTKEFSEVGSEARIDDPKAPVAHSESQTSPQKRIDTGSQMEKVERAEMECQTLKGVGCVDFAAQTVEKAAKIEHREAQTEANKSKEAAIQFTSDPFSLPEVNQRLSKLEEENQSLKTTLQNQRAADQGLKSDAASPAKNKSASPKAAKDVVELDVSKLDFVNGINSWEEKYRAQAEKVDKLDSAVAFLNSIISEQNVTIQKLKADLADPQASKDRIEGLDFASKPKPPKMRSYCDNCEVFDEHDTKECPVEQDRQQEMRQHTVTSPGAPFSVESTARGIKGKKPVVHRPFCDHCEAFVHETAECPNASKGIKI
ncbi:CAP-Gly domain-containing protein [Ditylenchus destructor]|nr:CAP-Gly domain-containing protein [Ditylenchus destructor]